MPVLGETSALFIHQIGSNHMATVFISYRSLDRNFAIHLAQSLKEAGHEVWIDQWRITGRDPYWYEIQNGIQSCSHFIFVITPDSISREGNNGALKELFHAVGLQQPPILVPVVGKETAYNQLPIVITPGMYQIHDFVRRSYDEALHSVLTALESKTTIPAVSAVRQSPGHSERSGNGRRNIIGLAILIPVILVAIIAGGFLFASLSGSPTPTAVFTGILDSTQVLVGAVSTLATSPQTEPVQREDITHPAPTIVPVLPTDTPLPPTFTPDYQATADTRATQQWSQVLGHYRVDGTYPDGSPYSGSLEIIPDGTAYKLDWTLPNTSATGYGVKIDDFLAAGYGARCGVLLFRIQPDQSLSGLFTFGGISGTDFEQPISSIDNLRGTYQSIINIIGQASSQNYNLTIADQNGADHFTWSNASEGFTVQNGSNIAVVYGQADAIPTCGVLLYHIQPDGSLLGQYNYGNGSRGTENNYR
jgi:hypothetical protein